MNNPKFSVGDKVAVCCMFPFCGGKPIVIPETVVTGSYFLPQGASVKSRNTGAVSVWLFPSTWCYYIKGMKNPLRESNLRPILPGEYLESTRDQAIGVGA
jgi:hypothetical protein